MCGFVAFIDPGGTAASDLIAMTHMLQHRGPNDAGYLGIDPRSGEFAELKGQTTSDVRYTFGMGVRRLSVLDPSSLGHQPMISESGRYALAYNGEIYNFLELRAELNQRGHRLTSNGDTEV